MWVRGGASARPAHSAAQCVFGHVCFLDAAHQLLGRYGYRKMHRRCREGRRHRQGNGLPPLLEQKRIVAKLDSLFGHLDTLKTKLDHIPELLKNFRQQVLTKAVIGKLTEEWRE